MASQIFCKIYSIAVSQSFKAAVAAPKKIRLAGLKHVEPKTD